MFQELHKASAIFSSNDSLRYSELQDIVDIPIYLVDKPIWYIDTVLSELLIKQNHLHKIGDKREGIRELGQRSQIIQLKISSILLKGGNENY